MELFLHYLTMPYMIQGIEVTLQVTALGLGGGAIFNEKASPSISACRSAQVRSSWGRRRRAATMSA